MLTYNGLVKLRNRIENAWAQIDVQLKRRYDLIPNLVETVKGYAAHERETLEAVIQARNMADERAGPRRTRPQAENMLTGALKSAVRAVSEAYPDLKANQNFLQPAGGAHRHRGPHRLRAAVLQRHRLRYNTKIQSFPPNSSPSMFSFDEREYFEADDRARDDVQVRTPSVAGTPPRRRAPAAPPHRLPRRLTRPGP